MQNGTSLSLQAANARLRAAFERHKQGHLAEAEREYRDVLEQQPDHPAALHYLGLIAQQTGQSETAVTLLQRSIQLDPSEPRTHNHLGQVLLSLDRSSEALQCFEAAVAADPSHVDSMNNLANALKARGELERAIELYRRVLERDPRAVSSMYNLANALRARGEYGAALQLLQQVVEIEPGHFRAHHNLGVVLEELGRFEAAGDHYRAVLRIKPGHAKSLANLLALCAADAPVVAAAQHALTDRAVRDNERIHLHLGLGRHFDRSSNYDEAFRHFAAAKTIVKRRSTPFHVAALADYFDRIIDTYSAAYVSQAAGQMACESERPVFIVGMPRSGTSLTEQILARHPEVCAAGELNHLPTLVAGLQPRYPEVMRTLDVQGAALLAQRYLSALDAVADTRAMRVTDKLPVNFIHIGLIATLFPRACIVHCRRDPLDVGLSCFTELFNMPVDYTADLRDIGEYLLQYQRLMAHWRRVLPGRMFELSYEDLVRDQEAGSRALLQACGLQWHEACLDFHEAERAVLTPSRWQVRQPIYTTSIGRWKNYAAHLQPLREMVGEMLGDTEPIEPAAADAEQVHA